MERFQPKKKPSSNGKASKDIAQIRARTNTHTHKKKSLDIVDVQIFAILVILLE